MTLSSSSSPQSDDCSHEDAGEGIPAPTTIDAATTTPPATPPAPPRTAGPGAPGSLSCWRQSSPPQVSRWELPTTYTQLKARILELEVAWEEDNLRLALEDPELGRDLGHDACEAYRHLALAGPPEQQEFRRANLHALLDEAKQVLREPQQWFKAATTGCPPATSPVSPSPAGMPAPSPTLITGVGPREPWTMRPDQAVAAGVWGIGLEFDDPADGDWLATLLLRQILRRLGSNLAGLHAISRWLGRRRGREHPRIVPDPVGRQFEQLMLDILNEDEEMAHQAPLFEDFLQKTDLRLHVPDLGRPRGARVQVTQTIHTAQHDEKLARIRRLHEFVILSPRSLSLALGEEGGARLLSGPDRDRFWECLGSRPASVEELATTLKAIFLEAILRAREDPRGPRAMVPAPVRLLVRAFAVREAYGTTAELRRREFGEGKWQPDAPQVRILKRHGSGDQS